MKLSITAGQGYRIALDITAIDIEKLQRSSPEGYRELLRVMVSEDPIQIGALISLLLAHERDDVEVVHEIVGVKVNP